MEITPELRARTRASYETTLAAGVLLTFTGPPNTYWACVASVRGAVKIDVIGRGMLIKFPTWQEAAAFHDIVFNHDEPNSTIQNTCPLPLHEPFAYETYVDAAVKEHLQRGETVRLITYTPVRR